MSTTPQTQNERQPLDILTSKPPLQQLSNQGATQGVGGLNGATLTALNSKGQVPSRWSINIQEIVKRTQKNLERGPLSQNDRNLERKAIAVSKDSSQRNEINYLTKQTKLGFGSSSTKDKNSLLYNDLKKKLSYDTAGAIHTGSNEGLVPVGTSTSGSWRKDNIMSLTGQGQTKMMRPTSVSNNTAAGLYLAGSQKSALSDKYNIARIRRRGHSGPDDILDCQPGQSLYQGANAISMHDVSATTGSIQGTQGGGEMYQQEYAQIHHLQPGMNLPPRTIQERQVQHQRTLMQAGRLNLIGAHNEENNEPDEEAHLIVNTGARSRHEFRRHNSNLVRPSTTLNLEIQDQQEILRELDDSQAIAEATATEEQTHRYVNQSLDRSHQDDGGPLTTNNLVCEGTAMQSMKLNQLRAPASTGNPNNIQMFTESQIKRATVDLKTRAGLNTGGGNKSGKENTGNLERRQKIFEEEIIKRIKEIQRYVKSLHLQVKKTQAGQEKLKEELDGDKDVLISLQQSVELAHKKYNSDKLKNVSSTELEASLKEAESAHTQKLIKVVQEATEQTLKQVRDEIVPDARMKMYDSISEETNRLKHDVNYQMQTLKREQADETKKDRLKSTNMLEKEMKALKEELIAEQSSQTLQILAQVDGQINKALKDSRHNEVPRSELLSLKNEMLDKIYASEQKLQEELQDQSQRLKEASLRPLEQRISELRNQLKDSVEMKISHISSQMVNSELLTEKMQYLKQEMTLGIKSESQKIADQNKALFVSADKFQTEFIKMKKDFSKQMKAGQEETKFDALQLMQSDMVEVTNQHKDAKQKITELHTQLSDMRSHFEETVQRMTNKEKDSAKLSKRISQVHEQFQGLENRVSGLDTELTEFKMKQESASKLDRIDSHRSSAEPNPILMEEIEQLRQEIRDVSNHCNQLEQVQEETRSKLSSHKTSQEKQITQQKDQLSELQKQLVDLQFEASRNKKFSEDQLTELGQSTEGLQDRLIGLEKQLDTLQEQTQRDIETFQQASERQFQNLHNGVTLLEEWQAKVKSMEPMQTVQTTEASTSKDERIYLQQQETIDDLGEKLKQCALQFGVLQARIDTLESMNSGRGAANEISSMQMMLASLSERNDNLQEEISACKESSKSAMTKANLAEGQYKASKASLDSLMNNISNLSNEIDELYKREKQTDASVKKIKDDFGLLREELIGKIETLEKETKNKLQPVMTTKSQPGSTWQESSVKKIETKKTAGWSEVRMTKIEPRDMMQSLRSSQLEQPSVASVQMPPSALKSVPPGEEYGSPDQTPFSEASPDNQQIKEQLSGAVNSRNESKFKTEHAPQNESKQSDSQDEHLQKQALKSSMSFEKAEEDKQQDIIEEVKAEDAINNSGLRKPTEYSASVDQQQPTARRDQVQSSYSEIEIKSPVQFEMAAESDVKVNETNSSQSNLLLQYRMAYDDDNNLNDKIISPSEGIQVPNADFYKLQREIRSSQVQKKNEMAIRVEVEQAGIESQKMDSPKPLGADDDDRLQFIDEQASQEEQQQLQAQQTSSKLQLPTTDVLDQDQQLEQMEGEEEEGEESQFEEGLELETAKEGVATAADMILDGGKGKLSESSQLFRTQKMAGLAMLSQKATQKHLEGLDEEQLEDGGLESAILAEESQEDGAAEDMIAKLGLVSAAASEEGEIDGIPASVAVLGMNLGQHVRKKSDGQSSMMGLSALGLESHRESQGVPELALDEQRISIMDAQLRGEVDAASLQSTEREANIHEILEVLIGAEIEQALGIMIELEHPNIVEQ